jgi:hypothetical protein
MVGRNVRCLLVPLVLVLAACSDRVSDRAKTVPSTTPGGQPSGARAAAASGPFAFHVNLAVDETAKCGDVQCDLPYLPKWHLYLRGTLQVSDGGDVIGEGTSRVVQIDRCATVMARLSSCSAEPGNDGTFTVTGRRTGAGLSLTLTRGNPIELKVVHRTKSASGPIEIPFDSTYVSLLDGVLANAGMFGAPLDIPLPADGRRVSNQPAHIFEGSFAQQMRSGVAVHSIHAFGSWYFIDATTSMPERAAPR